MMRNSGEIVFSFKKWLLKIVSTSHLLLIKFLLLVIYLIKGTVCRCRKTFVICLDFVVHREKKKRLKLKCFTWHQNDGHLKK